MTTGIYKLTFRSGKFYIGQSVNVENRWMQHSEKFKKGLASKPMQAEYNQYGFPNTTVLMVCHKDHLDMMESMYINSARISGRAKLLNTTIPTDFTDTQIAFVSTHEEYLKYSCFELMRSLNTCKDNVNNLQEELDTLHAEGIMIPPDTEQLIEENENIKEQYAKLLQVNKYLSKEANKSWFERLFN